MDLQLEQLYYPKVTNPPTTPSTASGTTSDEAAKDEDDGGSDIIDPCEDINTDEDDCVPLLQSEESSAYSLFQQQCEEEDFRELLSEVIISIFE